MKNVIRNNYTPALDDYCNTLVIDEEQSNMWIFDEAGTFQKTKNLFTDTEAGDIRGSDKAGYVSAIDGEGKVNGFAELKEGFNNLATVAKTGSYNDLNDKPTALKNPEALTIAGVDYDGSAPVTANVYSKEETYSQIETDNRIDDLGVHIDMTTNDPGEGAPLEPNHFIGVYR